MAENKNNIQATTTGDIWAVIRMGQDFQNNFYEIRIPLKTTKAGTYLAGSADLVWPAQNELNLQLRDLVNLKLDRDKNKIGFNKFIL